MNPHRSVPPPPPPACRSRICASSGRFRDESHDFRRQGTILRIRDADGNCREYGAGDGPVTKNRRGARKGKISDWESLRVPPGCGDRRREPVDRRGEGTLRDEHALDSGKRKVLLGGAGDRARSPPVRLRGWRRIRCGRRPARMVEQDEDRMDDDESDGRDACSVDEDDDNGERGDRSRDFTDYRDRMGEHRYRFYWRLNHSNTYS